MFSDNIINKDKWFEIMDSDIGKANFKTPLTDAIIDFAVNKIDDTILNFLASNGYLIIDKYDIAEINNIKERLTQDDKQLKWFQFELYEHIQDDFKCTVHIVPYFDSISNPMSEEDKRQIAECWMHEHKVKGLYIPR